MKRTQHIIIVRAERVSLSSMGLKSCDMIQRLLQQHYARVDVCYVTTVEDLALVVAQQPDLVLIGMKYVPTAFGEKLWLAEYFAEHDCNYLGSPATAIALDFDKSAAKAAVAAAGLLTASSFTAHPGSYAANTLPLSFPLFVKPPNGGGGQGIGPDSVVRSWSEYESKVQQIADAYQTEALVESYLPGREFSVALMQKTGSNELLAMPIELIADANAQGDRILGQAVKAEDTEHVLAVLDLVLRTRLIRLAKACFGALNGRDYGRIDLRLDNRGVPYFLEANLIPGLAKHDFTSYFTAACEINQHMQYEQMILSLVSIGLARNSLSSGDLALAATGHQAQV